jgi:hypothetical protein
MAGPASNFDSEIKKGMTGPKAKSSNGGTPTKAPKAAPKAPPATMGQDGMATGANGDTHAAMIAAGQAHMAAIHNHITAISGGKGAGGSVPVNQGTMVK